MRTKKYKKIVEDNGYRYYETNYSIIAQKYLEEHYDIEIKVGKLRPGRLEVNIKGFCGDESDIIMEAMELAETPPEDREEESFLTTKEFIEKVNNLGFNVEIIKDGNPSSPMYGKDSILKIWFEEELVAKIWLASTYAINTFNGGHAIYRRGYDLNALYRLCFEYAATPIEDREEEKKFYLKHKWIENSTAGEGYLNWFLHDDIMRLSSTLQDSSAKTQFTLENIKEIKEKFNTDLADFELVEVEDEKM